MLLCASEGRHWRYEICEHDDGYLVAKDAPRDIDLKSGDLALMPDDMRRELAELGLL